MAKDLRVTQGCTERPGEGLQGRRVGSLGPTGRGAEKGAAFGSGTGEVTGAGLGGWTGSDQRKSLTLPSTAKGPECPCVPPRPHLHLLIARPLRPAPRRETPQGTGTTEAGPKLSAEGSSVALESDP